MIGLGPVSQSVSQLFHGPAPRSPLHRLWGHSRTLVFDWTTATSMVALVFVRVRSGASAQLSGALYGEQYTS